MRKLSLVLLGAAAACLLNGATFSEQSVSASNGPSGWTKVNNQKYYYEDSGGVATGIRCINGVWRVFSSTGALQRGSYTANGIKYFLKGSVLEAYRVGKKYYRADGTLMSHAEKADYKTLRRARKVLKSITAKKDSKSVKLRKCFDWVMKFPYVTRRVFKITDDWVSVNANDHFIRKGGDCHADGAAFAYLARCIGYSDVFVCLDCDETKDKSHCWTEIDGRVYDPLFAQSKSFENNYGVDYSVYPLNAYLKYKVGVGYS